MKTAVAVSNHQSKLSETLSPGYHGQVFSFAEQFFNKLSPADMKAIAIIVGEDPFLNGRSTGQTRDGKQITPYGDPEFGRIIEQYCEGNLRKSRTNSLSQEAAKAFRLMAEWYREYRRSFLDPSETESIKNHVAYLRDSAKGEMNWDIILKQDPQTGRVEGAFSGQVLKTQMAGQDINFAWGEHIFVRRDLRQQKKGGDILKGFQKELSRRFGKTSMVFIEVDNPYGILDLKDKANAVGFNHADLKAQREFWTDPNGQNMAMNPFERMRVWHKMGFRLMVVQRKDLAKYRDKVAYPYNQIPLDTCGDPCETIFLAVRVKSRDLKNKFGRGQVQAKDIAGPYGSMQATIDPDFANKESFQASMAEIDRNVGRDAPVRLVSFCKRNESLNPEVLRIMQRTADRKFTVERFQALTQQVDLKAGTFAADLRQVAPMA